MASVEKSISIDVVPTIADEQGPKYARVKANIRSMILEKHIPAGEFLPSEKVLASNYQVSSITIKRALNDLASEGLVERKQGIGTVVVDPASHRPSSEPEPQSIFASGAVLFLASGRSPKTFFDLLSGVERLLAAQDSVMLYSSIESYDESEATHLRRLIRKNSVRVLLVSGRIDDAIARFVKALGPPVIYIGNYPLDESISQVCADVRSATRQAVEMLLDRGVKRLGVMNGGRKYGTAIEMARSFERCMEEMKDRVEYWQIRWQEKAQVAEQINRLLGDLQSPAGLIVEGGLEYDVLLAASKLKRRIPQDLRIILCDPPVGPAESSRYATRFESPWAEKLPAAVHKLAQLLIRQPSGTSVRFCFPMKFVAGDSH